MYDSKLIIVVPCYNEQEMLDYTTQELLAVVDRLRRGGKIGEGKILYVDDGSRDATWSIIERLTRAHEAVCGLKLAHNVGHQCALWAGLEWASLHGDVSISIDADLQDDTQAIDEMVDFYNQGTDIVYGVRRERRTDSAFKRQTALMFYRLVRRLGEEIVYNHADFRLMSRRAMRALMAYPERNMFLRGMVPRIGLSTACVYYDRKERMAGESKYPFSKMFALAMDGITSFSVRPLQWIYITGFVMVALAIVATIYCLIAYKFSAVVWGWTSIMISIWFIGGAMLVSLGIIGEYVGKIYREVKRRPRYFVEKLVDGEDEKVMGRDFEP
ncbi:glycosyltransferase family 2 protein [Phocaeicola coprophilus]|nr:glycosyltransferase family 2 protein [Phocaeicola coprophilus]